MSTPSMPSATQLQAQIATLSGQLEAALAAPESERQAARQAVVDVIMPFWPRMQAAAKAKVPIRLPPLLASAYARLAVHGRDFTLAMVKAEDDLPAKRFSKHLLGNVPYTVAPQGWWKGEHKKRPRSPAPPASGNEAVGEMPAPKRPKKVMNAESVAPAGTRPSSASGATLPDKAAKKTQDVLKGDEAKKRKAEVKRKAEETKRKLDEAKKREVEEARRKADETTKREAEVAKRKAEEAKKREAEEAKRKADETTKREAEVAKRKAEEAKKREAEEAEKREAEAKKREAEEAKRKAEEAAVLEAQMKAREAQAALEQAEEEARQRVTEARKAADLAREKSAQAKKKVEAAGNTRGKGPEPAHSEPQAKEANPVDQTKATTGRGKKPVPKSKELISTSEEESDEVEESDEDERPLALARRRKSLQSPRVKAAHGDPTQPPFRCDLCIKKDVPCVFSEWRARCDFCTKQKFGCSLVPRFVENGQPLKGAAASDKGDEFRRWVSELMDAGDKYPEVPIMTGDEDNFLQDLATLQDTPNAHESLREWLKARVAWSERGAKTACPKPPTARGRGMAQDAEAKRQSKAKSRAKAAAAKARAKSTSKPTTALAASTSTSRGGRAGGGAEIGEARDVEAVAQDEEVDQVAKDQKVVEAEATAAEEVAEEMAEPEVPEGYDDLFAEHAGEADDEDEEDEENRRASSPDESGSDALPARQRGFDYRTAKAPRVSFRVEPESDMDDAVVEPRFSVKAGMKRRNPNHPPAQNFQGLDEDSWGTMSPSLAQELERLHLRLDALESRRRTADDPMPEIMARLHALETRPEIAVQEEPMPAVLARLEALERAEPEGQGARLDAVLQRLAMLERNVGDTEGLVHEYDRRMQLMVKAQTESLHMSFQAALEALAAKAANSAHRRPSLDTGVQTSVGSSLAMQDKGKATELLSAEVAVQTTAIDAPGPIADVASGALRQFKTSEVQTRDPPAADIGVQAVPMCSAAPVTASQGTQAPELHADVRDDTEEDRVNAKQVEARATNEDTARLNDEAEGHSGNAKQQEDEAPSASSTPLGNIAPQDEALPTYATPTQQAQAASSAAHNQLVAPPVSDMPAASTAPVPPVPTTARSEGHGSPVPGSSNTGRHSSAPTEPLPKRKRAQRPTVARVPRVTRARAARLKAKRPEEALSDGSRLTTPPPSETEDEEDGLMDID